MDGGLLADVAGWGKRSAVSEQMLKGDKIPGRQRFRWWHRFRAGLSYLRYWLPIIWRDQPWDWTFIVALLRHKLADVEQCMRRSDFVGCEAEADHVARAVELCDRLLADEHHLDDEVLDPILAELCEILRTRLRRWWE